MAARRDPLAEYNKRRDFKETREPRGSRSHSRWKRKRFLVQKHDATRLHYDFRLEWDGVLKSWAVTRGPSLNPQDKRLAVRTEDHPLAYGDFEGTIPEKQYGGGTVMLWDTGWWEPENDPDEGLREGKLTFHLHGERLQGGWALVRMRPRPGEKRENWLLIKESDDIATEDGEILLEDHQTSVTTGRTMDEIAAGEGERKKHVWASNRSTSENLRAGAVDPPSTKQSKSPTLSTRTISEGQRKRKEASAVTPETPKPATKSRGKSQVKAAKASSTKDSSSAAEETVLGVRITHPERILFEGQSISKLDLARYYAVVADRMLPYAAEHLLSLVRAPQGVKGPRFYQKHASEGFPDEIKEVPVTESSGETENYMYVRDAKGVVAAVQMGTLEFHIWGSRFDKLETPDRLIFDLDPDEGLDFAVVKTAAVALHDALDEIGLKSIPMVTGGKGVHVIVPLVARATWPEAKGFAKTFAQGFAEREPDNFVATMSKEKRKGRIFIDWLRNERGATAIAPYSTRARSGGPVATPISWDELSALEAANGFRIPDILERIESGIDPWRDLAKVRQSLTRKILDKLGVEDVD
ncbi:non-homologous end-joining DNA ligase [Ensifer sp. ENS12]|uniref:non-homologous end-joining DNA ligase n=1 Tax=unclassified Ensifer TaxID=2633371 RepID=UPI000DD51440|nr:non-homologous end-joining DNA ligase [Ensifer sp. ENS12]MBV7519215.1 non-homologous end-joining DNA ligase [Ensifer sp. ENS12]